MGRLPDVKPCPQAGANGLKIRASTGSNFALLATLPNGSALGQRVSDGTSASLIFPCQVRGSEGDYPATIRLFSREPIIRREAPPDGIDTIIC